MHANSVLISVIVPTFNRKDLLKRTINSILDQTYKVFELIIVDDGSTDNTEDYVRSINDKRIRYFKTENWGGPARPRNIGIDKASGDYIAFCDDDDIWFSDKLKIVAEHIEKFPEVILFCHNVAIYDNGKKKGVSNHHPYGLFPDLYKSLLFDHNRISTSSTVVKREKAISIGGFSERIDYITVEDYDFWLRLSRTGAIYIIDKVLGAYFISDDCISKVISRVTKASFEVRDTHLKSWHAEHPHDYFLIKKGYSKLYESISIKFLNEYLFMEARKLSRKSISFFPLNSKAWIVYILARIKIKKFIRLAFDLQNRIR